MYVCAAGINDLASVVSAVARPVPNDTSPFSPHARGIARMKAAITDTAPRRIILEYHTRSLYHHHTRTLTVHRLFGTTSVRPCVRRHTPAVVVSCVLSRCHRRHVVAPALLHCANCSEFGGGVAAGCWPLAAIPPHSE